jgi:hypothetical protein
MGRIDDVLNVAGHRLGTMEIESALVAHPRVAEAAVVSKPHDIKGESVFAYVVLNVPRPEGAAAKALHDELRGWVGDQLSPIAKPDEIRLTDNLPKTRSGKIMRRLLRSIARGEEITQDMSTLENPAILEQLRGGAPASAPSAAAKDTSQVEGTGAGKPASSGKRAFLGNGAAAPEHAAKSPAPAKRAPADRRDISAKRTTKQSKRATVAKRSAAGPMAKTAAGAARAKAKKAVTGTRSKAAKKSKAAVKRAQRAAWGKSADRKAPAGKSRGGTVKVVSRRTRVKPARRRPGGGK